MSRRRPRRNGNGPDAEHQSALWAAMSQPAGAVAGDSFFAEPDRVDDWRKALLYDAAADAGLLAALPDSAEALSVKLNLDGRAVQILLDALAVWDLVTVAENGHYGRGSRMPNAEEDAVLRHHGRAVRSWSKVIDDRLLGDATARPGTAAGTRSATGMDALAVFARRWAPTMVDACLARFPDATTALDLGGGHGEYALELVRRGLRVTMQDRPEVTASVDHRLTQSGVDIFAGDFFERLPDATFDLVLLANVAHMFDAAHNVELYRRVLSRINPGGGLAIMAFVRGRDPRSAIFALQMLTGGGGGDAHTEHDYARWLREAGYSASETRDLKGQPQSLVLAQPQAHA